jgi:hypothetical protein
MFTDYSLRLVFDPSLDVEPKLLAHSVKIDDDGELDIDFDVIADRFDFAPADTKHLFTKLNIPTLDDGSFDYWAVNEIDEYFMISHLLHPSGIRDRELLPPNAVAWLQTLSAECYPFASRSANDPRKCGDVCQHGTLCAACCGCDGVNQHQPVDPPAMSWSELADLTHATQVETFGFCTCEDSDGTNPYDDCPNILTYCDNCERNLGDEKFDYRFDYPICLDCTNNQLTKEIN